MGYTNKISSVIKGRINSGTNAKARQILNQSPLEIGEGGAM